MNATELTEDLQAQRLQLMLDELKPSWTLVELQQLLVDLDDAGQIWTTRDDPEDDSTPSESAGGQEDPVASQVIPRLHLVPTR